MLFINFYVIIDIIKAITGCKMYGEEYIKNITECINKSWITQKEKIENAARLVAEAIKRKSNVYVFGCSHAGILAEEVFYRTGGLAVINPIFSRDLC